MTMKPILLAGSLFVTLAGGLMFLPLSIPAAERNSASLRAKDEKILYNSYSLLHDLLQEQRHASKLLLLKLESRELDRLIKQVSRTAADGVKQLEQFAESDPKMRLDETDLPPGEEAVRKSIEDTKRGVLLKPFNNRFEFYLLLTQSEALTYGWHLADNAAKLEPDKARREFLQTISAAMQKQHEESIELLRTQVRADKD